MTNKKHNSHYHYHWDFAVMMHFQSILLLLCLAVCNVQSKVDLKKGRPERVSFDGDRLIIVVDNTAGRNGHLLICFASSPDESYRSCPSGFTGRMISMKRYTKREFTLNREGQLLMKDGGKLEMWGTVKFNEDSTLNITSTELPDPRTIVTLQNAEIFVPEKPEKPKNIIKQKSNASVKIVAIVVVLMLVGVIIGILVWFCVIRKPESKQVAECDEQDDSPEPRRRSSAPRTLSAKIPAKRASKLTTPTTTQTTVIPKQVAHSYLGTNAQSPSAT